MDNKPDYILAGSTKDCEPCRNLHNNAAFKSDLDKLAKSGKSLLDYNNNAGRNGVFTDIKSLLGVEIEGVPALLEKGSDGKYKKVDLSKVFNLG